MLFMAKEQNNHPVNGILPNSAPTHYSKGAIKRLLEIVKKEKPEIRILSKPTSNVRNGRNTHKFPDYKKDCCIKLVVNCQSSKLSLPVSYWDHENDDQHFIGGLRYVVQVTSVRRYTSEGTEELYNDGLPSSLYCCCPLSAHRAGTKTKSLGFWFRFFGQRARFCVTISLKLHGIKKLLRGTKEYRSFVFCGEDCLVYSVDVDITNNGFTGTASKERGTNKTRRKRSEQRTTKQFPLLYSNERYKETMNKILDLERNQQFAELEIYLSYVLDNVEDCDIGAAVVLEQSLQMCRKGIFSKAKLRIKDAVDRSPKCKNKSLLIGRAYLYLSQVHQKDDNLGSAEECLEIARKKLEGFQPCEDVGDLCYQEGIVLMKFAERMSRFAWKLVLGAVAKFEEALLHYKDGVTACGVFDKLCSTHARLAGLALHRVSSTQSIPAVNVSVAENTLQLLSQSMDKLSWRTKYQYFLCQAEVLYHQIKYEEAMKYLGHAVDIEDTQGIDDQHLWTVSLRQKINSHLAAVNAGCSSEDGRSSLSNLEVGGEDGYLGDSNSY